MFNSQARLPGGPVARLLSPVSSFLFLSILVFSSRYRTDDWAPQQINGGKDSVEGEEQGSKLLLRDISALVSLSMVRNSIRPALRAALRRIRSSVLPIRQFGHSISCFQGSSLSQHLRLSPSFHYHLCFRFSAALLPSRCLFSLFFFSFNFTSLWVILYLPCSLFDSLFGSYFFVLLEGFTDWNKKLYLHFKEDWE